MRTIVVKPGGLCRHPLTLLSAVLTLGLACTIARLSAGQIHGLTVMFAYLAALLLAMRSQDTIRALWYGAILGLAVLAVPVASWLLREITWADLTNTRLLVPFCAVSLLAAVAGAVLNLVVVLAFRKIVARVVVNDGTTCLNCGYCVAYIPSDRCPECGTELARLRSFAVDQRPHRKDRETAQVTALAALGALACLCLIPFVVPDRGLRLRLAVSRESFWHVAQCSNRPLRETGFSSIASDLDAAAKVHPRIVTASYVRTIMGPPDLFCVEGDGEYYVYECRTTADEVYLDFQKGLLTSVGFNWAGVNGLSRYRRWNQGRDDTK